MYFSLVDRVIEASEDRAITLKSVSMAEEYLQDHFPGFPVLPGVMMLETMVQAGRVVAAERGVTEPLVLGSVRALRYNRFVSPGSTIRAVVELGEADAEAGTLDLRGRVEIVDAGGGEPLTAASGRFSLRPVRLGG